MVGQSHGASERMRSKSYRAIVFAASVAWIAGCGGRESASTYGHLFPDAGQVPGVKAAGEIVEYKDKSLYDFLNGGAELYFDYGIVAVASSEYSTGADAGIEISLYDMDTPENAFGVYSHIRYAGADFADIGNEAVKTTSSLDFWEGKYYCRLISFDTAPTSQGVMLELGRALAGNIGEAGSLPQLVGLLPEEWRVARSEKYFRKHLALNNIHYVDSDNVLNLGELTEGVVAQYDMGGTTPSGFIIRYATDGDASAAYDSYRAHLTRKGEVRSEGELTEALLADGRVTMIALRENHLVGVWDASDADAGYGFVMKALASVRGQP